MTSWTAPKTFTAGSALTASELNTYLSDNTLHLYERVVGYAPTQSSDQTKSNTTWSDITDLTFPVASGKSYTVIGVLRWSHSTNGAGDGPGFGYNHPGGTTSFLFEYTGNGSATGIFRDYQAVVDSGVVSQNDTAGSTRLCIIHGVYKATASGTFAMRMKRFSAGTLTLVAGSSLFVTSD
jgi:hypothetical protein